ncbi:hypothetical protein QTP86_029292, partial [Hemibagrus guttatus]
MFSAYLGGFLKGKTHAWLRRLLLLSGLVFDHSHCVIVTRVHELRLASDFGHFSATSQNQSATEHQLKSCSVNSPLVMYGKTHHCVKW